MFAGSRLVPFLLLAFLQEAVVIFATSAAEGLFLKRVGSDLLPGVYMLSALVSALASLVYAAVRSRFKNRHLAVATAASFALLALAIEGYLERSVTPVFYLYFTAVSIFVMLSRIQLWLTINRSFTTREAKRVFPLLTGAGLAGSIGGGLVLRGFADLWGPSEYQRATALLTLLYLALFAGVAGRPSSASPGTSHRPGDVLAGMRAAASTDYVRSLALLVMAHMLVLTLVDYQFNRVCDAAIPEESRLIGFLAMFRSLTNLGAFMAQMFLTHRVVIGLGVGRSLLVSPFAAVGYSTLMLLQFGFASGVVSKLTGRFLQRTVFGSLYQVLFNAVQERRRDAAMLFCDGIAYSTGTVTASALLWLLVPLGTFPINLACLAGAVLFLVVAQRLRREYLRVLVEGFEGQARTSEDVFEPIAGDRHDAMRRGSLTALARLKSQAIVPYLLQGLADPSPQIRLESVRGLASLGNEAVVPELVSRLETEADDRVRSQILRAFSRFPSSRVIDGMLGFLQDKVPRIRADLVEILGAMDDRRYARFVVAALDDREVRVRANAILALWRIGDDQQVRLALEKLRELLESREPVCRSAAAFVLGRIGNRMAGLLLVRLLESEEHPDVLRNTAAAASRTAERALVDPLLVRFEQAPESARNIWVTALKRVGRGDAGPFVRAALTAAGPVRILAIEMLGYMPEEQALDTLFDVTHDPAPELRISAIRSMTRFSNPLVETRLKEILRDEPNERVRATVLRRLTGSQARRMYPEMMRGLETGTDREKANTLEALTLLVGRLDEERQARFLSAAAGFLESPSARLAANAAYALWRHGDPRGSESLRKMLTDDRVRSALHVVGKTGDGQFIDPVSRLLESDDEVLRTRAAAILERIGAKWNEIAGRLAGSDDRDLSELIHAYARGGERARVYMRRALAEGREKLADGLADPDPEVRLQVLDLLQVLGESLDRKEALALLAGPDRNVRRRAAVMLARASWKDPPQEVRDFWREHVDTLYRHVWACGLLRTVATLGQPSLLRLAEAVEQEAMRLAAFLVSTFDMVDPGKNFGPISSSIASGDPVARGRALEALENLAPEQLGRELLPVLETDPKRWRDLAAKHFREQGKTPGIDALLGLVRSEEPELRQAAGETLLDLADRYILELLEREPSGPLADRAGRLVQSIERTVSRRRREDRPVPRAAPPEGARPSDESSEAAS